MHYVNVHVFSRRKQHIIMCDYMKTLRVLNVLLQSIIHLLMFSDIPHMRFVALLQVENTCVLHLHAICRTQVTNTQGGKARGGKKGARGKKEKKRGKRKKGGGEF